ncbi:MAG: hypothetical protein ACI85U_003969, partial [Candidatus Promineifilaceae bacterium]
KRFFEKRFHFFFSTVWKKKSEEIYKTARYLVVTSNICDISEICRSKSEFNKAPNSIQHNS